MTLTYEQIDAKKPGLELDLLINEIRVCPTRLTTRSGQIWRIMDAPAKIGNGLVDLDCVLPSFL